VNHHHYHGLAGAHLDRRRAILGSAAVLAGAALTSTSTAHADREDRDGRPQPAPKPIAGTFPGTPFHVFAPGPTDVTLPFSGLTLFGLDVDPSVMTDFKGFTALAYPVGTARGHDGTRFNLEGDMRIYKGTYVSIAGQQRQGTFGFV
jgi:hypothetical protein